MLRPCVVAFEAGFHTELKAISSSSSRYFIEHSIPVLFAHIFSNKGEQVAIIYWFLGLAGHHVTRKFKVLLSFAHIVMLVLSHNVFLKFVIIIFYVM
ncbi:hypothetical protein NC651_004173 [Populus alba x Populus x berolinensis]|nr:hypothetical protein NC651_004173 [Populus alba x Populus x berolinensis]